MPELRVHRDRLVAGAIVRTGTVWILPVEREVVVGATDGVTWLVVRKEPWALVLHDCAGVRALGPDGRPIALETVRRRVPGLDDLLAGCLSGEAQRPG